MTKVPAASPSDLSPASGSSRSGIANADEIEITWMKEPCGPCPFSRSKTLPLHPERAEDFAFMAQNRYTDFVCHKTAEIYEGDETSEFVRGRKSLTCNGFLSLQVSENDNAPEGFEPHPDAFSEAWEMIDHHTELWEGRAKAIETRSAMTEGHGPKDESAAREGLPETSPGGSNDR